MVGDHMGILGAVVFFFLPSSLSPRGGGAGGAGASPPDFSFTFRRGEDAPRPKVPKVPETVGRPRRDSKGSPPSDVHRGLTGVGAGVRKAGFAFCRRPRKGSGPARDTADG